MRGYFTRLAPVPEARNRINPKYMNKLAMYGVAMGKFKVLLRNLHSHGSFRNQA